MSLLLPSPTPTHGLLQDIQSSLPNFCWYIWVDRSVLTLEAKLELAAEFSSSVLNTFWSLANVFAVSTLKQDYIEVLSFLPVLLKTAQIIQRTNISACQPSQQTTGAVHAHTRSLRTAQANTKKLLIRTAVWICSVWNSIKNHSGWRSP